MKIFCTLGPSSLNKKFLTFLENKKHIVSLVRINLSHVKSEEIRKIVNLIRKFCSIPICIDTEGAQIRAKLNIKKKKIVKINDTFFLSEKGGYFNLYPDYIFSLIKKGDILNIGFDGLLGKVTNKKNKLITLKALSGGILENNKGIHVENRNIRINFLTENDKESIKIGKELNIKYYALSFTNTMSDLINFQNLLPKSNKIFKIETKQAVKNIKVFFNHESNFLIDRGDLSKSVGIEKIPVIQRDILKLSQKKKTNVSIATNFLESMIEKPYPTRAEVNDVYNALEMGAKNLVLAGETAIGKYPKECVELLERIIKTFKKFGKR